MTSYLLLMILIQMPDSFLVQSLIAIIIPIATGYVTRFLANVMKRVDAFAASSAEAKQLTTFVIAFVLSMITNLFGTADIGVILNTLLGGALAQLFYNGKKQSETST
jgi:uncharacterized membrane protein